jgi:hypothetical protein
VGSPPGGPAVCPPDRAHIPPAGIDTGTCTYSMSEPQSTQSAGPVRFFVLLNKYFSAG